MTETVPNSLSAAAAVSAVSIKRRQYLLLAGVGAAIVIGTVFSVSLTGSDPATDRQSKPKSTNILAPGPASEDHRAGNRHTLSTSAAMARC